MSLRFVTRPGCSLCQERLPFVRKLAGFLGVELIVEDLGETHPPDFSERIPVLLSMDGFVLAEGAFGRRDALCAVWAARRG